MGLGFNGHGKGNHILFRRKIRVKKRQVLFRGKPPFHGMRLNLKLKRLPVGRFCAIFPIGCQDFFLVLDFYFCKFCKKGFYFFSFALFFHPKIKFAQPLFQGIGDFQYIAGVFHIVENMQTQILGSHGLVSLPGLDSP